jgi:hypothetical protein
MENISIHDNQLLSYSVFCNLREIRFHTVFEDESTDIIFAGVVIYHFEGDNFKTVLFDIEETTLEDIYAEYENLFSRLKNHSWLRVSYETEADLVEQMRANHIKAYRIHSSYGLNGWVWAENMSKKNSTDV